MDGVRRFSRRGFVGGVACFFAFARLVLQRGGVAGAGYAVVFVTGASALFTMSHPAHALSLLFTFFPVVALDRYYSGGRRVWLGLAIAVAFVGSIYAVTPVFLSILLSWALFSMLGLVRIDRRHFVALVAAGAAGIVLHLVQVMVFLGPAVFAQELRITLSNRAFGVPSAEEVMSFYRSHGIVLNGIHELSASRLARALNQALRFPAAGGHSGQSEEPPDPEAAVLFQLGAREVDDRHLLRKLMLAEAAL